MAEEHYQEDGFEYPHDLVIEKETYILSVFVNGEQKREDDLVIVRRLVHVSSMKWEKLMDKVFALFISVNLPWHDMYHCLIQRVFTISLRPQNGFLASEEEIKKKETVSMAVLQNARSKRIDLTWTILEVPKKVNREWPLPYFGTKTFLTLFASKERRRVSLYVAWELSNDKLPYAIIRYVLFLARCPNPGSGQYFDKHLLV